MNALAIELDRTLETSSAYGFLSSVGRRMYFPKGIVAQSDEAKEKAKTYNATVGLATSKGQPMHLSDIMDMLREGEFKPSEIFNYAPGGGDKALRAAEGSREILEDLLRRAADWTARLGMFGQDPQTFLIVQRDRRARRAQLDIPAVEALLQRRLDARAAKDFAASDQLRDELAALGVAVRDTPEGQVWDLI